MTRHDEMLAETALREVRGLGTAEAVRRLEREGVPRCEALEAAAGKYCCSYEKARNAFYTNYKNKSRTILKNAEKE